MEQTQYLISHNTINTFGEHQMLVQHHVKYKEIHGVDEIKIMTMSEHKNLHIRLRKEGKCNIPPKELRHKVRACYNRTPKRKKYIKQYQNTDKHRKYDREYKRNRSITFSENIGWNVDLREHYIVYPSGKIHINSYFHPNNKCKLIEEFI